MSVMHWWIRFLFLSTLSWASNETLSVHDEILTQLSRPNYDKNIRPFFKEKPVVVNVTLHISSIRSVSSNTMEYRATILFRERWHDNRLGFNATKWGMDMLVLNKEMVKKMWVPDAYFPTIIESNEDDEDVKSLLRLFPDGNILHGRRISVVGECPMNLAFYPFDEQACPFTIESYGNPVTDIVYNWEMGENITKGDISLPNLILDDIKRTQKNVSFMTGNYTRLVCCFMFKRSRGYYFIQLYVPAAAVVITTWFALWLRVSENSFSDMINLMLTVTLLYFSYNTIMPPVSYVKAMDLYLIACFVLVVAALIKTAIAQGLTFNELGDMTSRRSSVTLEQTKLHLFDNSTDLLKNGEETPKKPQNKSKLGKLCGLSLPLVFFSFCLVYFAYFLIWPAKNFSDHCKF